jgi:hypothetical protein
MKLIILLLFFFSVQRVIGQEAELIKNLTEKSYDYYSFKQHQNKAAARICLISGIGLVAVGGVLAIAGVANSESSATPIGVGMFVLGVSSTVASIPLFILAGSNKRKARFSLKAETVFNGTESSNFKTPLLSLSIPLN